jgi:hypothetical protein
LRVHDEILRGAGKTFPRTWQSLEILICRTFGTLSTRVRPDLIRS